MRARDVLNRAQAANPWQPGDVRCTGKGQPLNSTMMTATGGARVDRSETPKAAREPVAHACYATAAAPGSSYTKPDGLNRPKCGEREIGRSDLTTNDLRAQRMCFKHYFPQAKFRWDQHWLIPRIQLAAKAWRSRDAEFRLALPA